MGLDPAPALLLCVMGLITTSPCAYGAPAQDGSLAAKAKGASVSWGEFHLELARRHRGKALGKDALAHIVQRELIILEARKRQTKTPTRQIEHRIDQVRASLKQQNIRLEDYLGRMGMTLAQFRFDVKLSLLGEILAREDLGLDAKTPLRKRDLDLWVQDSKRRHKIKEAPGDLPPDACLAIGDHEVPLSDLGAVMAKKLAAKDRQSILREMMAYRLLRKEAKEKGVRITKEMLASHLARRRAELAADPKYKSLSVGFDDLIRAQGRNLSDFVDAEVFRAQVLMIELEKQLFDSARLDEELKNRSAYWLDRIGPSRKIFRFFLAGVPEAKKKPGVRTLQEAKKLCKDLVPKLRDLGTFIRAAKVLSDDSNTKKVGGNCGFLYRKSRGFEDAFLKACFIAAPGTLAGPIQEAHGYSLCWVSELRPSPRADVLRKKVRRSLMSEHVRKLLQAAKLEFFAPTPH